MASASPDYIVVRFDPGPIEPGMREVLLDYVDRFEPLDFEAGHKAKAWLDGAIRTGRLAIPTELVLSEDQSELVGFFAVDDIEVEIAAGDVGVMQMRKVVKDPNASKHKATKLVWIARSRTSQKGLGGEMFEEALAIADIAESCALMLEPYDDATEGIWTDRFDLRRPRRGGAEEWSNSLWHPVGDPPQDFC